MEPMQPDRETISLKKIIIYYLRHWKLFVIAGLISFIPALLYLIFTPKTYEMMAKIQLLEDKSSAGSGFNVGEATGLMKSFGLGGINGGSINLDDEMAKLTSNSTLKEMVLALGLNISYYKPYAYQYKMYEDKPLRLIPDSATLSNLSATYTFDVSIKKDGKVSVKIESPESEKKIRLNFESLPAEIKLEKSSFILSYTADVVKPLSMDIEVSPAGWTAETLSDDLLFEEYSKNANVIEISYTDYEKSRGLDMLNKLIDIYNQQEDSVKRYESEKSIAFLDGRIQSVMSDLSKVEMQIERYKIQNKMTDIEYDVQFYVEQVKDLQVKIIELEAQMRVIDLLDAYIKDPQNRYNLIPSLMSISDGEKASPISTYNEALLERAKILQSTKGDNPLVDQVNRQVDQLRESVYLSIENAQKGVKMTLDDLTNKEKLLMDKMGAVPSVEREYIDYKRQQEIFQAVYLILLQKREDLALSIGEKKERARVIETPYVKQFPIGPRKLYAAFGMLLFTLLVPVGYLFGKEQLLALIKEYKQTK
ncbi:Wzz/FepE/Etk N-terminal domain-containing protein [Parabacteroides gordonii]|jgi:tyrosine-protein kinase Etk/Wzc|uniref:GumC family protein n=1 Tax=Parabacteroides gordonii TaxID=574930 RepID=UPI00241D97C5|nr:Wzz/FepE/Etk N-terminal domain-containing protein [Parabacteroides gordonii]